MSSRSLSSSLRRQIMRFFRRHRPMLVTGFVVVVAVLGALFLFTRLHPG